MRSTPLLPLLLLLAACTSPAAREAGATADLIDRDGRPVGTATFTENGTGVHIDLDLHGLPPGHHAAHVHERGAADPPDFKSAGDHFNPAGRQHGLEHPQGPHAGDLPNILVKPDGTFRGRLFAPAVSLGEGPNSLFKPGGTSFVIHDKADDGHSQPSGNAGDRIACGVIHSAGAPPAAR